MQNFVKLGDVAKGLMMAYERKDNSGSLWKNKDKKTDKHPSYKGQAKVNGVEYWVSLWNNTPPNKEAYLSLQFEEKERKFKPRQEAPADVPFDDEIPW